MTEIARRAAAFLDRAKGGIATASLTLATAATNAGSACAAGRCGQGCGFACGVVGLVAAGGVGVAALRRWSGARDAPPGDVSPDRS